MSLHSLFCNYQIDKKIIGNMTMQETRPDSTDINLVSKEIEELIPYPPGKPIEELEREYGISNSIKLASNENALGPSPMAVKAVKEALTGLHRYPDGSGYYLKERLSGFYGVDQRNIILGNGSNEIIELLARTFLQPGDEVITAAPTFVVYRLICQAAGGKGIFVPLKELTYNLKAMSDRITDRTKLIFIANPNNPTGTIVRKKEFDAFIDSIPDDVIIVLDEAYIEYVTDPDFPTGMDYWDRDKMVIVLRTFSKIYGLAGLRIGYGIANEYLIQCMNKVRQPFNVNSLAQTGALAAIDDREHIERSKKNNMEGLKFLFTELEGLGFKCVPTQSNFFLIKVGGDGEEVYKRLLYKGVIVRPMNSYGLKEYIRITVGLPAENRRFLEAFKEVME